MEILPATFGHSLRRVGRLTRKELSEILRDRRTIITLVLMPVLLYPLLSIAFQQFLLASGLNVQSKLEYKIAFVSEGEARRFFALLAQGDKRMPVVQPPPQKKHAPAPRPPTVSAHEARDLAAAVRSGEAHLAVRVKQSPHRHGSAALDCDLLFSPEALQSQAALDYVERRLAWANVQALEQRVDLPGPAVTLVRLQRQPLLSPQGAAGISLAAVIPLILILMTITGAVYPAIDLTAGERERGTLEILVAAPVPRLGLLFAKYVSVVTVAVLTAVVNLTMMMVTLMVSGLGPLVFQDGGLSPGLVVELFVLLLLFAAFFSAVLLALSSFARSFKEAQAYLIPLMLVSLAPGLIGLLPGLELSGPLAVAPLVNIVLLGRDLLQSEADGAMVVLVVLSTLLYAAAAIAVAARVFGAEGVLYSEQNSWSDLFRRPAEPQSAPTLASALFCFALLFPTTFVLQSALAHVPPGAREIVQFLASATLFAGMPLAAIFWRRVHWLGALQWRPPALSAFLGALLLGPALVPWTYQLLVRLRELGLTLLGPEQEERIRELVQAWRTQSPVLIAGTFAATAIVEELFFRGFLFSALRRRAGAVVTIVASALLFGLSHAVFSFDRLLPSTLLGLVLGWLCWTSRSVIPAMVLHAGYNAVFILLAYYQPAGSGQSEHVPVPWLGVAGAAIAAAVVLVQWKGEPGDD